jgi:ATP-binding cassette subfamily F protein uup
LSGGERNRLLLCKLLTKPSNLLVLDEPTNDLDAETLELLEDLLVEYPGTVLLVSHDRAFLNNVVSSVLVLEGDGKIGEYVGGYDDWLRQDRARKAQEQQDEKIAAKKKESLAASSPSGGDSREAGSLAGGAQARKKLSFKEQRELDALPDQIQKLEDRQSEVHEVMSGPNFYKKPGAEIARLGSELQQVQQQLAQALARWEELETRRGG